MEERIVTVGAGQAGGEQAAGLLSCQVRGLEFDEARRQVRGVRLACHGVEERLEADLVLVGIGLLPNTELASAAGLAVDNGIVVDEFACTADPDILAIGDCANQPSAYTGGRIRIESVPNQTKAARSSTPGRPGFFFFLGTGSSGATRSHSASGTRSRAMVPRCSWAGHPSTLPFKPDFC